MFTHNSDLQNHRPETVETLANNAAAVPPTEISAQPEPQPQPQPEQQPQTPTPATPDVCAAIRPPHVPADAVPDGNGNWVASDFTPDPEPTDPRKLLLLNLIDPTRHKRNSGRTGATTPIGRAIAARNATRHGLCSQTLILPSESQEDYNLLEKTWLTQYGNPAADTVLYTFVIKTVKAEWFRQRAEREYDFFFATQDDVPMSSWSAEQHKKHDLQMRYLTAAERKFQREYKLLMDHFKAFGKPAATVAPVVAPPPPATAVETELILVDNESGVSLDEHHTEYPAPAGYTPEKITPGHYTDPNHPSNWQRRKIGD